MSTASDIFELVMCDYDSNTAVALLEREADEIQQNFYDETTSYIFGDGTSILEQDGELSLGGDNEY